MDKEQHAAGPFLSCLPIHFCFHLLPPAPAAKPRLTTPPPQTTTTVNPPQQVAPHVLHHPGRLGSNKQGTCGGIDNTVGAVAAGDGGRVASTS